MIDRESMSDRELVVEASDALDDFSRALISHRSGEAGLARERYRSASRELFRRRRERRRLAIEVQRRQFDLFGMEAT